MHHIIKVVFSVSVLKKYDLKIYDKTLAEINKLNEKDNIQILNNVGIHIA